MGCVKSQPGESDGLEDGFELFFFFLSCTYFNRIIEQD